MSSNGTIETITVPLIEYLEMKKAIEEMNSWRCSQETTGDHSYAAWRGRCRNAVSKESMDAGVRYCVAHLKNRGVSNELIDPVMGSAEATRAVVDISQAKGNGLVATERGVSNSQIELMVARYGLTTEQLDSWDPEIVKKIQGQIQSGVSLFDPSREIIMLRGIVDALRVERDELTCRNCANAGIRSVVECPTCSATIREFNMEKVTDMIQKTGKAIESLNKIVVNHRYVAQVFGDLRNLIFLLTFLEIGSKIVIE